MDPTAATTTVTSILDQRLSIRAAAPGVPRWILAHRDWILIKTQTIWNSPAIRPWRKLRTITPLYGPPKQSLFTDRREQPL